jgi:hypothetical protein
MGIETVSYNAYRPAAMTNFQSALDLPKACGSAALVRKSGAKVGLGEVPAKPDLSNAAPTGIFSKKLASGAAAFEAGH